MLQILRIFFGRNFWCWKSIFFADVNFDVVFHFFDEWFRYVSLGVFVGSKRWNGSFGVCEGCCNDWGFEFEQFHRWCCGQRFDINVLVESDIAHGAVEWPHATANVVVGFVSRCCVAMLELTLVFGWCPPCVLLKAATWNWRNLLHTSKLRKVRIWCGLQKRVTHIDRSIAIPTKVHLDMHAALCFRIVFFQALTIRKHPKVKWS